MVFNSKRRSSLQDNTHTERWLISYADYMTLLFAVFVVLYAFAIVKEENYAILSQSFGTIFHLDGQDKQGALGNQLNNVSDSLLDSSDQLLEVQLFNKGLLDEAGTEPVEGDSQLINLDKKHEGTPFSSMVEKLQTDLLEVLEDGYAKIEQDDNWLTIEFSGGLLFGSASAATRPATIDLLRKVVKTIAPANNFVHVRGYTDDQPINNEQFKSNWQLSSARASAIVELLQQLEVAPQRLAIEAYGQYKPKVANIDEQTRSSNRRVVIAVSRYAWQPPAKPVIAVASVTPALKTAVIAPATDNQVKIIELPHGGLRITTRDEE